jgi:hypothetical protein
MRKFPIGDFEAGLAGFRIQSGMNLEAGGGGRRGDEADNSFKTSQMFPAPFLADIREESMLDLISLACPRRERAEPLLPPASVVIGRRVACG